MDCTNCELDCCNTRAAEIRNGQRSLSYVINELERIASLVSRYREQVDRIGKAAQGCKGINPDCPVK